MAATTITLLGVKMTVGTLLTVASMAYQLYQSKKMKKMMRDAAESRKGFEIVSEGDVYPIPTVYGRAKIGGIRAYTNTSHNFYYTEPNSDIQFLKARSDYTRLENRTNGDQQTEEVNVTYTTADLSQTITGSKNEFLFIQQALCQGPINRVIDVVFDESRYLDDPDFVSFPEGAPEVQKNQAGLRVDVHYGNDTNKADAIITRNFNQRENAYFTNLAHASIIIRQYRSKAQFNQVPMVQFFIEGKKVRTISSGVLSSERVYSNNPAYCLLDYLLEDSNYSPGKNLSINDIDLASFEAAAQVCNTIVDTNKPLGGKIWKNTEGTFTQSYRDIPLYECNIVLDSSKKIRENIEAILGTMGDARLVWSQGKYKLLLQYPSSNETADVATTITDDDIVRGSTVEQNWPDSSQKLNHCIVRFHNESENFKEDSASWPPKTTGTITRGFNGKYYPAANQTSEWGGPHGPLLNNYAVWDDSNIDNDNNPNTIAEMFWKFIPSFTAQYFLEWSVDDTATFEVRDNNNNLVYTGTKASYNGNLVSTSFTLQEGIMYTFRFLNVVQGSGKRGAAFKLEDNNEVIVLTSRSISYEDYVVVNQSSAIYDAFLVEDNNIELEEDVFLEGCTDYYHALAKAEELVRTSRTALSLRFRYNIKDKFLEPGDIVRINSETLNLGGSSSILLRVNEVRVEEGLVCEVSGTRFDYTQLAWNVADDEYIAPLNIYNNLSISGPAELIYEADSPSVIYGSAGLLRWIPVEDNLIVGYILYIHRPGNVDSSGRFLFDEIGRVGRDESVFNLPSISVTNAIFGIRAFTANNTLSGMTTTGTGASLETIVNPLSRSVEIVTNNVAFVWQANNAGWNVPSITLNTEVTGYTNPFYQWYIDDVFLEGETGSSIVVLPFDDFRTRRYKVEVGETGNFSNTQTEDFITLLSVQEGSDAYIINLTNESVQIETGSDGSVPSGTFPLTIGTGVVRGSTIVTTGYGIVYSLEEPEGIVATIDSTTGVITVTAITGLSNTITVVAEVTPGVFLRKLLYISKLVPGVSPPLLSLKTTSPGFLFENSTATTTSTPDSITLTAVFENVTGQATFVAEAFNIANVSLGNLTLPAATHTASDSTVVISDELFASIANVAYVRVTASLNSLSDTVTLYRLNDGENALNLYMHNENHSVPANSDGTVIGGGLLSAFTYIFVFQGINNVTNDWAFTKSDIGMNTILTQDSSNPPRMLLQVQSVTNTIATTTVTATRAGYPTLEKVFTITKSIAGQDGIDGDPGLPGPPGISVPGPRSANGYIYYKSSTSNNPGQPSTGTYNFTNGTFSSLNSNWTLDFTAPSSSDGQYWAVRFSVSETTYGGSQNIELSSAFKWQNLNGLITFSNIQAGFNAGVTSIDGGKIVTNSITADQIASSLNYTNGSFSFGEGASIGNIGGVVVGQSNLHTISGGLYYHSLNEFGFTGAHGLASVTAAPDSFAFVGFNSDTLEGRSLNFGAGRCHAWLAGEAYGGVFRRMHTDRWDDYLSVVNDRNQNVRTQTYISDNNYGVYTTYSPGYGQGIYTAVAYLAAFNVYGCYASAQGVTGVVGYGYSPGYSFFADTGWGKILVKDGNGPFTGFHIGEIQLQPEIGDIVVDKKIVKRIDISNVYFEQQLSCSPNEKGAIGVVSSIYTAEKLAEIKNTPKEEEIILPVGEELPKELQNYKNERLEQLTDGMISIDINAIGEGQVNVCGENGNIEIGDLIVTSSIPGKGMKQDDDIVRSYTVAKSRENVTFDSPDQIKTIACIYLCG